MKVSSKNIIVKNSFKDLKLKPNTKDFVSLNSASKIKFLSDNFSKKTFNVGSNIKSVSLFQNTNFIKAGSFEYIPKLRIKKTELAIHKLKQGFNLFSCSFDLSKFINIYEDLPSYNLNDPIDYTNKDLSTFFKNTIYEYENDSVPYYYKNENGYSNDLIIVKNYIGSSYLPNFNYNKIGVFQQREGYSVKTSKDLYFKGRSEYENVSKFKLSDYSDGFNLNPTATILDQNRYNFENSWYTIGTPFRDKKLVSEYFKDLIDNNQLVIIKTNEGDTYIQEFKYFGFEYLEPFQAYEIKFQNL